MRHKNIVFGFVLAISVLCASFLPSSASAVQMAPNVHPIWTNANPTCAFYVPDADVWQTNAFSNNASNDTTRILSKINCDYPAGLPTKNTYAVYSFRLDNYWYNDSADSGILAIKANLSQDPAKFGVIGVNISAMGSTGYQFDVYLYGEVDNRNGGTIYLTNPLNANEIMLLKPRERISFVGASYWQVTTDSDFEYNYTDVLKQINTKLGNTNSGITSVRDAVNSTNSKLDTTNNNLNDLKSTQEQANQDANDRYQDEKDTISDNTDSGKDTMEDVATNTTFSLPNPFRGIMSYFTNSCSASIPTIAGWLHAPTSSYPSWWCSSSTLQNIKSSLTGIISFISVILVFKFCWRWLATNEGEA